MLPRGWCLTSGAVHLTLDAVAERAGVSKGGLLYHFPSKESLLQAMVDRNMRRLSRDHADGARKLSHGRTGTGVEGVSCA